MLEKSDYNHNKQISKAKPKATYSRLGEVLSSVAGELTRETNSEAVGESRFDLAKGGCIMHAGGRGCLRAWPIGWWAGGGVRRPNAGGTCNEPPPVASVWYDVFPKFKPTALCNSCCCCIRYVSRSCATLVEAFVPFVTAPKELPAVLRLSGRQASFAVCSMLGTSKSVAKPQDVLTFDCGGNVSRMLPIPSALSKSPEPPWCSTSIVGALSFTKARGCESGSQKELVVAAAASSSRLLFRTCDMTASVDGSQVVSSLVLSRSSFSLLSASYKTSFILSELSGAGAICYPPSNSLSLWGCLKHCITRCTCTFVHQPASPASYKVDYYTLIKNG